MDGVQQPPRLVPPNRWSTILQRGLKGGKKNLMDQRTRQMVEGWRHRNSRENSRCWKDGVWGEELVISRERRRLMEGERPMDVGATCFNAILLRDPRL